MASEALDLLRIRGRESVLKSDYQKYGDSPTVKYYTKWRYYDDYLLNLGICNSIGLIVKSDFEKVGIWKYSAHEDIYPIGKLIRPDESKIIAGHYASLRDSLVVEVRDDSEVELRVGDGLGSSSIHSRHIILVVKKRVKADIVIDATNYENDALETLFVEAYLGKKSRVNLLVLNNPPKETPSINVFRFAVDDSAKLNYGYIGYGGQMHHQSDTFFLNEGSFVRAGASFISRRGEKIDYISNVIHERPNGESYLSSQGIIFEDGYGVARGMAKITRAGEWSKTIYQAGVVLLGEGGKGYASPMLEIDTGNVVEARHEAKEARLGEEQLFYLMTRGLSREEAMYLLTYGLMVSQVDHLSDDLQELADEFIKKQLTR